MAVFCEVGDEGEKEDRVALEAYNKYIMTGPEKRDDGSDGRQFDQQNLTEEQQLGFLSPNTLSDKPSLEAYRLLYQKLQREGKSKVEALASVAAYVYAWAVAKTVLEVEESNLDNQLPDNKRISTWLKDDFMAVFNFGRRLGEIAEGHEVMAVADIGSVIVGNKLLSPTFGLIKIIGVSGKYEPVGPVYKIADFPRGRPSEQMMTIADRFRNRQINMQEAYGPIGIPPAYREMFFSTMDLSTVVAEASSILITAV